MKIAVLSSHTPSLFWFRLDMMKEFIKRGNEVIAVGNEETEKWEDKFSQHNIKYIKADVSRNGTNPVKDLKTLKSLKEILKKEKPDKIFAYQAKTVIYGGMAAHSLGISEFYPLIAGVGSVFLSDGIKASVIRKILLFEYKKAMKQAKMAFFQNNDDIKVFEKYRIISSEKIAIMHGSGVNLEKFTLQELPEKMAFLFIGRLIKDKGVCEYLEAAKNVKTKYPDVRFLLVGPFDTNPSALQKNELQEYTDGGVIEYFGEQSDVRPYLDMCSVFVLPSYREGTPKTVLEAMACGKAIITTDAPGCKETVIDGENGFLVPPKDSGAVEAKMIEFIEHPELIPDMASKGRKLTEDIFDVNKVNDSVCSVMQI